MGSKIEIILRHDGDAWTALHEGSTLRCPTLSGLDDQVRSYLREKGHVRRGERLEVFMAFDMRDIPQWMRQYSQHYFNRIIEVRG
jgi:hypothetical protein